MMPDLGGVNNAFNPIVFRQAVAMLNDRHFAAPPAMTPMRTTMNYATAADDSKYERAMREWLHSSPTSSEDARGQSPSQSPVPCETGL
jgi:hypothetical protein